MADTFDKETRSQIMRQVKGKNTKPEMLIRKLLFNYGFRYRLHDKTLPGRPDIKLSKYNTIVFINGCFWHGHMGCKSSETPKSNVLYWKAKIKKNRSRDEKNIVLLKKMGWKVIVIWECEIKPKNLERTLQTMVEFIRR